jgi:hypothetical protein
MIPYVDTRLRGWVSWRLVARPRAGSAGYYAYRTILGDLRKEESGRISAVSPGGSRTERLRWIDDREPLEIELVVRHLPEAAIEFALLAYLGVSTLAEIDSIEGPPRPLAIPQLESKLGICRRTVYSRLDTLHARMLDALNEPRLDRLIEHVARKAALDKVAALAQNRPQSARVGKAASPA